ncbi:hypothetical protein D3C86_2137590 [compost metagenome]
MGARGDQQARAVAGEEAMGRGVKGKGEGPGAIRLGFGFRCYTEEAIADIGRDAVGVDIAEAHEKVDMR